MPARQVPEHGHLAGLIFRRAPFVKLPDEATTKHTNSTKGAGDSPSPQPSPPRGRGSSPLVEAMRVFTNDVDMLGTTLQGYSKNVVAEVLAVGRVGTLIDWEGESENRVYVSRYAAENILNWRVERLNGRNLLTLVVLAEKAEASGQRSEGDKFEPKTVEQLRVLKLVRGVSGETANTARETRALPHYIVEIWQKSDLKSKRAKPEWQLVATRTPLRLGKPLPLIPFVFHGHRHSLPAIEKPPLADVIAVNLDHYRLDAAFKHGMHFTALPTAWVSGFDKEDSLRIGSSTAWTTETVGASAGFLEYTGQGLKTFERALDRDERLMAVLGARLLEGQKRMAETAEAIELRQSGENSILGNIAQSVSASLTQILAWAYWWNSTEELPEQITNEQVLIELNSDFSMKGMSAQEIVSVVKAWQSGALSRDSMLDLFRRGEILPEGRTNDEEIRLIARDKSVDSEDGQNG